MYFVIQHFLSLKLLSFLFFKEELLLVFYYNSTSRTAFGRLVQVRVRVLTFEFPGQCFFSAFLLR